MPKFDRIVANWRNRLTWRGIHPSGRNLPDSPGYAVLQPNHVLHFDFCTSKASASVPCELPLADLPCRTSPLQRPARRQSLSPVRSLDRYHSS